MGAGDTAGSSDLPDFRAHFHHFIRLNPDFGEMRIHGVDAIAVVNHYGVAGIIEVFGEYDFAGLRSKHRRASSGGEVDTGMR